MTAHAKFNSTMGLISLNDGHILNGDGLSSTMVNIKNTDQYMVWMSILSDNFIDEGFGGVNYIEYLNTQ